MTNKEDTVIIAKILIYYRNMPANLEQLIKGDAKAVFNKDGGYLLGGVLVPRATVLLESKKDKLKDDKRLNLFDKTLNELLKSGQIVSFTLKRVRIQA